MPKDRQNFFRLVSEVEAGGEGLDELLGPPRSRPGELHEPFGHAVPEMFLRVAAERAPLSLAVGVTVERELAVAVPGVARAEALLDVGAGRAVVEGRLSAPAASYARELLSLLHPGVRDATPSATAVVVPVRVAERLRVTGHVPRLDPDRLVPALRWELAAVLAGQTLSEWALARAVGFGA